MFKKFLALMILTITASAQNFSFNGPTTSAPSNLPTVSSPTTISQSISTNSAQAQQQIDQQTTSKFSKTPSVPPQPIVSSPIPTATETTTSTTTPPPTTAPPTAETTTTESSTTPESSTPPESTTPLQSTNSPTPMPPNPSSSNVYTGFRNANTPSSNSNSATTPNTGWNIKY